MRPLSACPGVKMVLKSWEEKFHRGSFSLFFFFFLLLVKVSRQCSRVICTNTVPRLLRIWFLGLWIIQRGEHFIKHPDGGLTVASCSRLLPLILPFFLFNKSSPAQTLTTETEETSGWYRFDHSLWSSDFAHTLRQLVSIFFCSFLINVTPWPSVKGQQHFDGTVTQTWDGGPGAHTCHRSATFMPQQYESN